MLQNIPHSHTTVIPLQMSIVSGLRNLNLEAVTGVGVESDLKISIFFKSIVS